MSSFLFVYLTIVSSLVASCLALTYPIVDTGVTSYFDDSSVLSTVPSSGQDYYGQDAHYSGNQPSYVNNGDGTITDQVTGLQWQQSPIKLTYSNAKTYVKTLTSGGYSDWRIPTIKELYSLIQFSGKVMGTSASSPYFIDTTYFEQPLGNTSAGEREIDAQTQSATQYVSTVMGNTQKCNFGVNFIDGRIKCYRATVSIYFRFVRGVSTYGTNDLTLTDNGATVTDSATGLVWQQSDSGYGMEWKAALAYCENLNVGGYSDWRLPNIKELNSLVDYTKSPATNGTAAISSLFAISSILEPDNSTMDYPYFWSSTTHWDGVKPSMAAYQTFGRAWGAPYGSLIDVHGAGAQRSDPKTVGTSTYPDYFGPQLDLRTVSNYVRCVRSA